VKPPDFDYAAPADLDEVLRLLAGDSEAKLLAGGQSLVPLLALRLAAPSLLIDLRKVPGLNVVERSNGVVNIGAMVRQRHAERDATIGACVPLLSASIRHIAHPQIRSRGTIGGSVAHADPSAELPAALVALDARIRARGPAGVRVLPAGEFFSGFLTTTLNRDEVVTSIELDVAPSHTGAACIEIAERAGDYALCGAVAQVRVADNDRIVEARIALFGVGDRPVRAGEAEAALIGAFPSADAAAAAATHAVAAADPIDDPQAPAEYRLHLAEVVTRRAVEQAIKEAAG
jgi:aerobic carbon-monoxide dehydrogenase medium subunit